MSRWPDTEKAITMEALRALYEPSRFRIAEHRYPPGTAFDGSTRKVTWFVLSGACRVSADQEVTIQANDVAELDAGGFSLLVLGDVELHLAQVWDLSPHMN